MSAKKQEFAPLAGRWRILLIGLAFLTLIGAAGVRLGQIASTHPESAGKSERTPTESAPLPRAEIVDRRGQPLVGNAPTYEIYLDGKMLPLKEDRAEAVAELVKLFPDLAAKLTPKPGVSSLPQQLAARKTPTIRASATPLEAKRAKNLGIPGLYNVRRTDRVYFAGRAAAHVLGYVSVDGVGQAGLEGALDLELRKPEPKPMRISLDLRVQRRVWRILGAAMTRYKAKAAAAIVMDARNGELRAVVSLPDFDPHRRPEADADTGAANPRFFWATSTGYEPGSTMKLATWALALEHKLADIDTKIDAPATVLVDGRKIGRYRARGMISITEAFARSVNTVAIKLALRIGAKKQKAFFQALGLMEPSSVEIAEARAAWPSFHKEWRASTTATVSFGHGMQISPLQLAEMTATLIAGGERVRATLRTGRILSPDRQRVVSPETSAKLRKLFRETVRAGTGKFARVAGLDVGGKTGTAEKVENDKYVREKVVANFIAAFPMSDPQYVVVVMLDEPSITDAKGKVKRSATYTAAPTAGEIIASIAPLLGVAPVRDAAKMTH
ncbi:MAG: penicillin-binding protein 2 [Neomegalonema sp.]|nr:penicillin-binding protein 2 [Neomegalonema sp.]